MPVRELLLLPEYTVKFYQWTYLYNKKKPLLYNSVVTAQKSLLKCYLYPQIRE